MKRYVVLPLLFCVAPVLADPLAVRIEKKDNQVIFSTGDQEILRYQAEASPLPRPGMDEAFRRGGYLHPLRTPGGRVVTDDYPENHMHHHGVWMSWTKTKFDGRAPDFWNMGAKKGRVEFVAIESMETLPEGSARLRTRHRYVDLTTEPPVTALDETWEITVSAVDEGEVRYQIDFTAVHTCATDQVLELPEYHYGGIGFRGLGRWDGKDNCRFLTSEGVTDREKAHGTRAKWCWIGGTTEGDTVAGVTILCHPDNFRAPQPMRIHPEEPFFCFAPQQLGDMELKPGEPYTARYRIVVTDGEVTVEKANGWWESYSGAKNEQAKE